MNRDAYLCLWIDTRTGRAVDVGIYSEETPTQFNRHFVTALLHHSVGKNFEDAHKLCERYYATHPLARVVRLKRQPRPPLVLVARRT